MKNYRSKGRGAIHRFSIRKDSEHGICLAMMGVVPMTKTEIQTMYEVMFTDYPDIVNVAQVQSMLNISRHLAYSLINDGYIPGIKIGNAYRVPKVNVINYALSAGNSGPAA